ncbi:MAG: alpha-1,2-fucosyltransferase, partial [Eubacterium sp.]|nr:alpha-1,2-fucosyltransferase [Eubacterium sp.]
EKETQEKKRLAGELEKNQKSTATAAALKELEQRVSGDEELIAQLRENCRQTALLIERQSKEKSPAIQRIGKGFRYIGSWADARRTIILQMRDRLGNQMFIYALYCRLKSMGRNVAIDDASWYLHTPAGKNALKDAFRLEYKTAGADAVRALEDTGEHRFDRLRRKLFGRRSLKYSEQSFQYDPVFLRAKKGYFTGWFQDPRYFQPVAGQVRESFGFDMDALRRSETAGPLYREITERKHAVSIHLRYGDYLKPDNAAKYGGICSAAYYCAGIRYFRELFPDDRVDYYVFSDDTGKAEEWIRDVFEPLRTDRENAHIVSNEKVTADNLQMALMSACHHHIIANSTFSWWAAFLNPSKEKIIIRPSVWFFENGKSIQPLSTDVPAVTIAPDGEIL